MDKINVNKDEYKDDKYKEDNSEYPKIDESVINKTEAEESLTDWLMSMNFPIKIIQCAIGNISSCKKKMIQLCKKPKQR